MGRTDRGRMHRLLDRPSRADTGVPPRDIRRLWYRVFVTIEQRMEDLVNAGTAAGGRILVHWHSSPGRAPGSSGEPSSWHAASRFTRASVSSQLMTRRLCTASPERIADST